MAKLITVRSLLPTKSDGGNPVALYETHEDHPEGEAFVAGPGEVQVARTGLVHRLISDGTLEEVGAKKQDDDEEEAPASGRAPAGRRASGQPEG